MAYRIPRTLILLLAFALGACDPSHIERMQITVPPAAATTPALKNAIAIGQVSGGSPYLDRAGVTDGEFKEALENTLRGGGILAPSLTAARWRLDAGLNFDPADGWAFTDQHVDTAITYRLFAQSGGEKVFERLIRTSDTKEAPGAGVQALTFLLAGVGGLDANSVERRKFAYEQTVRQSLGQFLAQLGDWSRGEGPAVATIAPPAAQPARAPPPAAPAQSAPPATVDVALAPEATPDPAPPHQPVVFGDSVEFRCPAPRTEIAFRAGGDRVFGDADGIRCPYESAGRRVEMSTVFGTDNEPAEKALGQLWPLRVGNEVSFNRTVGSLTRLVETFRVARHEMVTVPAGSFDSFVIERTTRASGYRVVPFDEHSTYWYAPEIGYVVKFAAEVPGGSNPGSSVDEAVRVVQR